MARLRGAAAVVLQRHSGYYLASHVQGRGRTRKGPAQSGNVDRGW